MHVILAAGGTGGHIEPALNVADAIRRIDPAVGVTVIGSDRGLEQVLVPARGYELIALPSIPLPRRPSGDLVRLGPRLRRAVREAADAMQQRHASAVLGFGGYAAVPAYLAARRLQVPLVIHEANARPGIANRMGARFARAAYEAYPGTIRGARPMASPLRRDIAILDRAATRAEARAHFGLNADGPVLLVFGGSQGARRLNDTVAQSVPRLWADGIAVLHAYGARNDPPEARPGYVGLPFIDRMDLAYAAADLVVARAGAMTCAELAAVGLPAVYVPLPIGNGEQSLNARPVVDAGGGLLIDDSALTAEWLTRTAADLLHDGSRLAAMSAAAYRHGVRDAAEQLARITLRAGGMP
ncbi:MAG: undecaprenyldiphospho-muramoylpentapeptide beta-N-acetylglucosaminyltransferase [Actinomycetota bacterium]|nr:undecaprenyldiphospho-muramoylpentapeptide beta-N-acetylglucosaminyltransferase [Actinomycetota bacterium]